MWIDKDGNPYSGSRQYTDQPAPEQPSQYHTSWNKVTRSWSIPLESINLVLTDFISLGQDSLRQNPLPLDIQEKIYELESSAAILVKRRAWAIIQQKIQDFTIDQSRIGRDLTQTQYDTVMSLKSQILQMFQF